MRKKNLLLVLLVFLFTYCSDDEPSPTAIFAYSPMELNSPCTVSFQNFSENAESFIWDFDDGHTSTENDPSHYFEKGGYYNIKLRAINKVGEDEAVQKVLINQSTSYRVNNNSSFNLKYVSSFYDSNNYIMEEQTHGDLSVNEKSKIFVTNREAIRVLFKFNVTDDYWALTYPYKIRTKYLNELILADTTSIIPVTINSNKKNSILEITTISNKIRLKDFNN